MDEIGISSAIIESVQQELSKSPEHFIRSRTAKFAELIRDFYIS